METENIKNELFEKLNSKNLPLKNNTTFTDSFYPENNPQSNKNNKINEYKSMVPEKKTRPLSYKKTRKIYKIQATRQIKTQIQPKIQP